MYQNLLESNSHWVGEYLQKKYEIIKEACDYQDYLIEKNKKQIRGNDTKTDKEK